MFQNKVVVITGGANGIGQCIAEEFKSQGAKVCIIVVTICNAILDALLLLHSTKIPNDFTKIRPD